MTSLHNDERPVAIIHATAAADAWRSATLSQRAATPGHSDFYNLTGEVVDTLQALSQLFAVLRIQIAGYADGRIVCDDEPGHDLAERLIMACGLTGLLQRDLDVAEQAAQRFWSEIGHIAVEDPS